MPAGQDAVRRLLHHLHVLHVEGFVEAPFLADVDDVLLGRVLAGHPFRRIATGNEDEDDEDEEADGDEDERHPDQPPQDERAH